MASNERVERALRAVAKAVGCLASDTTNVAARSYLDDALAALTAPPETAEANPAVDTERRRWTHALGVAVAYGRLTPSMEAEVLAHVNGYVEDDPEQSVLDEAHYSEVVAANAPEANPAVDREEESMQPIEVAHDGVIRFRGNAIIERLFDSGKLDLNEIATWEGIPARDHMQLAQLLGYSIDGYGTLSYVTQDSYERAEEVAYALRDKLSTDAGTADGDTGDVLAHPVDVAERLLSRYPASTDGSEDQIETIAAHQILWLVRRLRTELASRVQGPDRLEEVWSVTSRWIKP